MKRLKILFMLIIPLFLGTILFSSCQNSHQKKTITQRLTFRTTILHHTKINGVQFPDGTKAIRLNKSKVKFIFPKGVQLWLIDNNHIIQKLTSSDYPGALALGKDLGKDTFAFVNLYQKISPVQSQKEYDSLSYIPGFLLSDTLVRKVLINYAKSIYKNSAEDVLKKVDRYKGIQSDINNIVYVQMKMFGYKFIYGISYNDLTKEQAVNNQWDIAPEKSKLNCKSNSVNSVLGVKLCKGGVNLVQN